MFRFCLSIQPATENLEPEPAVKLAAMANDKIAAAVTTHPTSVDDPYSDNRACKRFLENLPISLDDKEKVAHLNAERLLKFKLWPRYGTPEGA